jgi:hypothetical protein
LQALEQQLAARGEELRKAYGERDDIQFKFSEFARAASEAQA